MNRRLIATLLVLLALAGCNTVAGVGEDITGMSRLVQGNLGGRGGY
ncbi:MULTISPECIES: hypothetical protein [unclassified Paracoccus (in: a-proteobacteria)]|nr:MULTISPECIES: hypothetical protein [unclassified Paracoccus (in: a-proteobacteria)]UXU74832.1 hypothetical protein GB879_013210 [Paracoccus sp. SMMA_5]UXU80730.1 hypothetical protein GB880_013205 [Paracoccus sp. SMMA_5_TC]